MSDSLSKDLKDAARAGAIQAATKEAIRRAAMDLKEMMYKQRTLIAGSYTSLVGQALGGLSDAEKVLVREDIGNALGKWVLLGPTPAADDVAVAQGEPGGA